MSTRPRVAAIAILTGGLLSGTSFWMWHVAGADRAATDSARAARAVEAVFGVTDTNFHQLVGALRRLDQRWNPGCQSSTRCLPDVEGYFRDFPSLRGLGWQRTGESKLQSGSTLEFYMRRDSGVGAITRERISPALSARLDAVLRRHSSDARPFSDLFDIPGEPPSIAYVTREHPTDPWLVTLLDPATLLGAGVRPVSSNWMVSAAIGPVAVFSKAGPKPDAVRTAHLGDLEWSVGVRAVPGTGPWHLHPVWVLVAGLVISTFTALVLYFAQLAFYRSSEYRALSATLESKVQQRTQELTELSEELRWRVAVEQEALESLERRDLELSALMGSGHAAVWSYWPESGELLVRAGNQALFGVPLEDQSLPLSSLLELAHPDDRQPLQEALDGAAAGAWPTFNVEFRVGPSPDNPRWVLLRGASPQATSKADVIAGVGIDITDRKRMELAAQQASRAKSDFLANMSHEIRTPMNAILGMAEFLMDSDLSPEQRRYVEIFQRAGAHLLELINGILDLSKVESGRLELESANFDLHDCLDNVIAMLDVKARSKGLTLELDLAPNTARWLVGDSVRLRQVLVNLVGNAIKFTEQGRVRLSVRNASGGVPGDVEFAIADTGPGIPKHQLSEVFKEFSQGDASITSRYGGTGLGLAISRRLVECMGGMLAVDSELGIGSVFHFTAHFGVADPSTVPSQPELAVLEGRRVLIADDSYDNRLILRETLAQWGLLVTGFADARDALRELDQSVRDRRLYDLVILDTHMHSLDGFQAARHIREMVPGLPIIMVTSEDHVGDAQRRMDLNVVGFAVRPFKREVLLALIRRALTVPAVAPRKELAALQPDAVAVPRGRILVADDSSDNQFIVQTALRDLPYELSFADDGEQAVEKYSLARFELVLMDIRMPHVDGLEATRRIRELERERALPPVPILALTANADKDSVEASAAAGCVGHLAKPVSKGALRTAVLEYLQAREDPLTPSFPKTTLDALAVAPEIASLVPQYLSNRHADLLRMQQALQQADFETLAEIAHNIKGTGTSYGFPVITRIAAELQSAARGRDAEALARHLGLFQSHLERVQRAPVASS